MWCSCMNSEQSFKVHSGSPTIMGPDMISRTVVSAGLRSATTILLRTSVLVTIPYAGFFSEISTTTLWILRRRMSVMAYETLESGSTTTTGLDIQSRTVLGIFSSDRFVVRDNISLYLLFYNQFDRIHRE